ncbi:hypothetical protein Bca52824_028072 [Brassica carinata]|uniref:Uncharacterized protein n=1 Tax=Brassica carinata TaxID=52824 RepID=A0A8X7VBL1_BRACI|nr:hypothetical protein Bca52824_028072 [Brassica carinata]
MLRIVSYDSPPYHKKAKPIGGSASQENIQQLSKEAMISAPVKKNKGTWLKKNWISCDPELIFLTDGARKGVILILNYAIRGEGDRAMLCSKRS